MIHTDFRKMDKENNNKIGEPACAASIHSIVSSHSFHKDNQDQINKHM